uniref:Alpha-carbonic anhydrase domain-containing protein n=1 Tax=Hippocampus comes TaxID=109280 RepID=A0A3Q2YX65_HIPCM
AVLMQAFRNVTLPPTLPLLLVSDCALNQRNWGKKYPSCSSARQSPVDIDETFTQVRLQYQNLRLESWDRIMAESTTIHNNGKTVAINVDGDFYVSGGGLSSRFRVDTVTFHWGRCNATSGGSEHSLNGMKYPLEVLETNPPPVCLPRARFGLILNLQVSLYDNENLNPIIDAVNTVTRFAGKSGSMEALALQSLLPNNTAKYYIYNGSLTSPPCSETVEWVVFQHTVAISETQASSHKTRSSYAIQQEAVLKILTMLFSVVVVYLPYFLHYKALRILRHTFDEWPILKLCSYMHYQAHRTEATIVVLR